MARGIDIRTVGLVININVPRVRVNGDIDYKTYLHRVARTGRYSDKGVALTLIYGYSNEKEV
jgi:superfamily II DNA/RNA helicase